MEREHEGDAFAIGTFSPEPGEAFAGLVLDERVARLDAQLGSGVSVRTLLDDWEPNLAILQELADRLSPDDCPYRAESCDRCRRFSRPDSCSRPGPTTNSTCRAHGREQRTDAPPEQRRGAA